MDPFLYFSYDKIYEICEKLPTEDLNRFVRTSKRIRSVCQKIIDRRRLPELPKRCSSDFDLISLEPWSESPPDVFIRFLPQPGKRGYTNCYKSESLKEWLSDPDNQFARWVRKDPDVPIDNMGHGGEPHLDYEFLYFKLYTGEFIYDDDFNNFLDLLIKGLKYVIFDAEPLGIKRLGNTAGNFGISKLHGQMPGYQTYILTNMKILNEEGRKIFEEIVKERRTTLHELEEPELEEPEESWDFNSLSQNPNINGN